MMTDEAKQWEAVTDRYMSDAARADFEAKRGDMATAYAGFDQAAYSAKWKELGTRIKAALPLDPASDAAQAFVAEWNTLLEPFTRIATPAMMDGARQIYAKMDEWEGQADPGFDHQVFQFIQAASAAKRG